MNPWPFTASMKKVSSKVTGSKLFIQMSISGLRKETRRDPLKALYAVRRTNGAVESSLFSSAVGVPVNNILFSTIAAFSIGLIKMSHIFYS